MINTLYGAAYDHRDIARKIITKTAPDPFIKIVRNFDARFWHQNLSLSFEDDRGDPISVNYPGLYAIYRKHKGKLECLYVGQTGRSIHNRIRRFMQALEGTLRKDESHPGGERARADGVKSTDDLYIKVIKLVDISNIDEEFYNTFGFRELDEYVAPLLKSKYNTRKAYA
jgi:hypothetical protein